MTAKNMTLGLLRCSLVSKLLRNGPLQCVRTPNRRVRVELLADIITLCCAPRGNAGRGPEGRGKLQRPLLDEQ
jgi:hypothetical protein